MTKILPKLKATPLRELMERTGLPRFGGSSSLQSQLRSKPQVRSMPEPGARAAQKSAGG